MTGRENIDCLNCDNYGAIFCAQIDLVPLELREDRLKRVAGRFVIGFAQALSFSSVTASFPRLVDTDPPEPAPRAIEACIRAHNPDLIRDAL